MLKDNEIKEIVSLTLKKTKTPLLSRIEVFLHDQIGDEYAHFQNHRNVNWPNVHTQHERFDQYSVR